MGYEKALEAAGATVHAFQEFGSYQGDWLAKVSFGGNLGWIRGSYGSCSGCDAFQSEFDYDYSDGKCNSHEYTYSTDIIDCSACDLVSATYQNKLKSFGLGYLDGLLSQEEVEKFATENLEWDMESLKMVDFVKENSI